MSIVAKNVSWYLSFAVIALVLGIAANQFAADAGARPNIFDLSLVALLIQYCFFHIISVLAITLLSELVKDDLFRAKIYLIISTMGLGISALAFNPFEYGAVHFFVIYWGGLFLTALRNYLATSHPRMVHSA